MKSTLTQPTTGTSPRRWRVQRFRADELIRIGSGTTTVEKTRAGKAVSQAKTRAKSAPRGAESALRNADSPRLSQWIEATVHLPFGLAAEPGQIKLPPYLRAVADSMIDPAVEKVTIMKSARIGFSTLLSGLIAYHLTEEPAPVLVVLPAELDARNYVVSLEEVFDASPKLAGKLPTPATAGRSSRNTLLFRRCGGGASLRLVGATAPRNLRAITARLVLIDECDALIDSAEGAAISLAEARSITFKNRRTIIGGTPLLESTSHVARSYAESDMQVFEVPCPACGTAFEIVWSCIQWPEGRPAEAHCVCPACGGVIEETSKGAMVEAGRWRSMKAATADASVPAHRGFRISSLVSPLPNASWARLAAEWLRAKDDDNLLKVFTNVVLGMPWSERADEIDPDSLAARREPFDLDRIPKEVLAITAGTDCQDDRLETTLAGHGADGTIFILAHIVTYGSFLDPQTWEEFDQLLRMKWRDGLLRVDAACVDCGDGDHFDTVMKFCNARSARRVMAVKGVSGFGRANIVLSKSKRGRLFLVGVDGLKSGIIAKLARGRSIRFSDSLDENYFSMLASEKRVVRWSRGKPQARFERIPGRRAEAIDALCYASAARSALTINFGERQDAATSAARGAPPPPPRSPIIRSAWMNR